jgi:hypothetical protein
MHVFEGVKLPINGKDKSIKDGDAFWALPRIDYVPSPTGIGLTDLSLTEQEDLVEKTYDSFTHEVSADVRASVIEAAKAVLAPDGEGSNNGSNGA